MALVPEGSIVVRAKFSIEVYVAQGVDFYAPSCRVPAKFTVVGVLVPLIVDEFAIVMGIRCIKVKRSGIASMTSVGTPEISRGRCVGSDS